MINSRNFIIFLILINFLSLGSTNSAEFWSNKVDGPKNQSEAIKLFEGKKLDMIEGLWFDQGIGTVVIYEDSGSFKMYIVDGPTEFNGTWEATILKRNNQYDFLSRVWYSQTGGKYTYGTQSGRLEVADNYFYTRWDSLSNEGVNMDSKFIRVWPKNSYTENNTSTTNVKKNKSITDSRDDEFYNLPWYNLDNSENHWVEIPKSNAEVNILKNEIYLIGHKNINKFTQLLFQENDDYNDLLIVDNQDYNYSIYSKYLDEGYVSIEDWNDVNPQNLLNEMKSTAKDDVVDVKWIFKPKISDKNFVSYSYQVSWKDNSQSIETTVLSLGRKGYLQTAFVTTYDEDFNAKEFEEFATGFAETISFNEGYRYADYKSGDKTAAVGIGGLVAGTLGLKVLAKAGVLSKLLALAFKFWWIILAPLVALFTFKKKENSNTVSSTDLETKPIKKTPKKRKKTKKID